HDDASHTAHAKLNGLTQFHVATVPRRDGAPLTVTLPAVGAVRIGCEIHDEMHALVVVSRSAFYAVPDGDRRGADAGVPSDAPRPAVGRLRLAARRRWSKLASVLIGCALAFSAGILYLAGLHGAVATALGFGAFLGTVVFGAAD